MAEQAGATAADLVYPLVGILADPFIEDLVPGADTDVLFISSDLFTYSDLLLILIDCISCFQKYLKR